MRFVMMHKQSASEEASAPLTPEFLAGMGQLMGDAHRAGVFEMGEGLKSSHHRVRIKFVGGQRSITKGPYVGDHELIAGFALVKVKSIDEAIDWTTRFAKVVGDVEVEIGEVCEPWDLGFGPKPDGPIPTRYLIMDKATKRSESAAAPDADVAAKMGALVSDMKAADVFIASESFEPSSQATRIRYKSGKRVSVVDGPFAESKELIAGFSLFKLNSKEEAMHWTDRFGALFPDVEVDLRPIQGESKS